MIAERLRTRRLRLEADLAERGLTHTLSLARFRLHHALSRAISDFARGRCLDAGTGRSPYRGLLVARGCEVLTIDVEDRSGTVDIIGDLQSMQAVESSSFDTVLCTQVLEHVPRPWDAMCEMARVLRPGGHLILSVPHLSVIHEAPHDYYRFTEFGLRSLLEQPGLEVVRTLPAGGLLSFLGHGVSAFLMSTLGVFPVLRWPVWLLNYAVFVRLLALADALLGMESLYPCDLLLVAQKPTRVGGDP